MTPVFAHGRLRLYLLRLLDESPRHGYDVIRALEDRFLGLYTPSAGTVYPRLARLTADGLVEVRAEGGRKVYSITDAGRAELAARSGELDDLEADIAGSVRDLADEIRSEVSGSVRDLRAELKQAAKEARQARRRAPRPAPARPTATTTTRPTDDDVAAWVTGQLATVTAALTRLALTDAQRRELRDVLTRAADDVVRIVRAPRPPQDG